MSLPDNRRIAVAEVLHWGDMPKPTPGRYETDWDLIDDVEDTLADSALHDAEGSFGFITFRSTAGKFYRLRAVLIAEELDSESEAHPDGEDEDDADDTP